MKKVLIDCERLKYPNTGLFSFCKGLGNALSNNENSLLDYTFYVPKNISPPFGSDKQYKTNILTHKLYIPQTSYFDVWHITHQGSNFKPYNSKTKIVYTIHDLNFLIEKKNRPKKINSFLRKIQKNIDQADIITCISEYVKKDIEKHFDLHDKTIHVIHNGVAIQRFPNFNSPRFVPKSSFIFSIGTILPKKNFHVIPCLISDNTLELIIAGNLVSQDYIQKIKEEARKHNVLDRVHVIGSITDEEKYWYYTNCVAFIFTSLAEGFGLPVIEAMHFEKPVFLSKETSLPEIGGDVAYYFDSFEPIEMQQVFKKGLTHYRSKNSHKELSEHAKKFSWDNIAKAYQKLYLNL